MIPAIFRIDRRTEEFTGTFTLHLSWDGIDTAPQFQPGQFNMLYAFGAGEVPISMSGPPTVESGYVHTIRAMGLVTQALERLREGDQLGVRGPFGKGWPLAQVAGREVLIIAGGLGLAPLRPVVYALLSDRCGASAVRLFYGARRPQEMLYRDEFETWSQQMEVHTTVDHAGLSWTGHIGVITSLLASASIENGRALAFICGPEFMMRFCIQTLLDKGLPASSIYLSMERNMKCAIGHCGHCQWGPNFICKDGPVLCYEDIQQWFQIRAL